MDALALFAISLATIAAANHAAVTQYYATHTYYAHPVTPAPAWEPAPVVYLPVAPVGPPAQSWIIGNAAPVPAVQPQFPVDAASLPRERAPASSSFIEHWQNFIEPSVRGSAGVSPPGFRPRH